VLLGCEFFGTDSLKIEHKQHVARGSARTRARDLASESP